MQDRALSVTECLDALNDVLHTQVVVVEGEVNSYNVSQGRWVFFSIRDEASKLDCFAVLFKMSTPLEPGMKVRITGTPNIYKARGTFSLTVDQLELVGEGALQRAFELLKKKLEVEGLFAVERKRPIIKYPRRIALIASESSAAYTDFIKVLNNRWRGLEIDLVDTSVQGERAVSEIETAFNIVNDSPNNYDAVVLTRGGGSLEDLHAFNDERVARAVARCRVPVICGVGHERDVTIADFVSDIRAATPSNAAEILTPDFRHEIAKLKTNQTVLVATASQALTNQKQNIRYSIKVLVGAIDKQTELLRKLSLQLRRYLNRAEIQIADGATTISLAVSRITRLQDFALERSRRLLRNLRDKIKLQNPKHILKKGFSIVRIDSKVVRKVGDVALKDALQITLSDGNIDAIVSDK